MKRNHGDMPVWNFIFKEAFFMPFNRKPQKFNAAIKSVVIMVSAPWLSALVR